jgi:hypothetical protein
MPANQLPMVESPIATYLIQHGSIDGCIIVWMWIGLKIIFEPRKLASKTDLLILYSTKNGFVLYSTRMGLSLSAEKDNTFG